MKAKHIKKETAKRLREGYYSDLMDLIGEAVDIYTDKNFSRGYDSFFDDASVHAHMIAELLHMKFTIINYDTGGRYLEGETEAFANVIEEYFDSLKTE